MERTAPAREIGRTPLRFWTEAGSGTIVLHAEGEVDLVTAPMLGDAIAASYRVGPRVILDLSRVYYFDGAGIRVLEDATREHAGRFVVAGSNREIRRLFEILDLVAVLPAVHSIDAAREYFGLR